MSRPPSPSSPRPLVVDCDPRYNIHFGGLSQKCIFVSVTSTLRTLTCRPVGRSTSTSLSRCVTTRRGRVPEVSSPLLAAVMLPKAGQHLGKVFFNTATSPSSLHSIIIIHRLLMETVMDVGDHRPGVNHRPVPAEPSSISPWYYSFFLSNTWFFFVGTANTAVHPDVETASCVAIFPLCITPRMG